MNESAKQMIGGELRELRRLPGELDTGKVTRARGLLKGLGGDDPDIAIRRLIDIAQAHADDREIAAAFASIGLESAGISVLDRFTEFGLLYFVDARTVRRWSDAGIRKLALLIVGKEPWVQPRVVQTIVADGSAATVRLDLYLQSKVWMNPPILWVDGHPIDFGVKGRPHSDASLHHRTEAGQFDLRLDAATELRLWWSGERYPAYQIVTRDQPAHTFESRLLMGSLSTSIRMS